MSEEPRVHLDARAVLWSSKQEAVADRPLIVLLHGYGSHEGDLFGLSPMLPLGPVVASLRAPWPQGQGHAWFDLGVRPAPEDRAPVDAPARAVLDWLDDVAPAHPVALVGFSQGGAMALQAMRLAPDRFSCVAVLSGFVAGSRHPGDAALAERRIPVFWGRGTGDAVIPAADVETTGAWLDAHAELTARVYEGLAHTVSPQEIADLSGFLRRHVGV